MGRSLGKKPDKGDTGVAGDTAVQVPPDSYTEHTAEVTLNSQFFWLLWVSSMC